MKTLLIDNYDSFTYNLFQLLAEANGEEPIVVRNDALEWAELEQLGFDNVVLSPGPGRPDREGDFGICAQAIEEARVPLLGVCLGHQGIAWVHGGGIGAAPEPMHGRRSAVLHNGSPLFAGIPREFQATRYHSLRVEQPLPRDLESIAITSDGVVMAIAHRSRPQWGVQFHPESICTEYGRRLLANFRDLTPGSGRPRRPAAPNASMRAGASDKGRPGIGAVQLELRVRRLETPYDAERAFANLFGDSDTAFWLDSSRVDERGRFSFIGSADGPLARVIVYDVASGRLRIERAEGSEELEESVFDYLSSELHAMRLHSHELPFDFNGGFVGYLGYELKADCGGAQAHRSRMPDAAFVFADRVIAFDHVERCTYLVCAVDPSNAEAGERWLADTDARLRSMGPLAAPRLESSAARCGAAEGGAANGGAAEGGAAALRLSRSHEQYLRDIATCHERLIEGETYEICLTNKISAEVDVEPLELYRVLRRVNPAPFSAYLRFGGRSVLSSSPERFLRVGRDRWVESTPIKGTCRRGATPAEDVRLAEELRRDEKSRAENLMIADLLRNDLGAVCEIGTVHVPRLMDVESVETVHHLVSTVRGLLRQDVEPTQCIRACFPGGSMTGAPKRRTMEIIDELEGEARGVYAGAIGFLGLSGGCDLSIVIRTIVLDGRTATIGVGGAIVTQSDAEEEFQEALLKARAPMAALDPGVDPRAAFEVGARTLSTADHLA